MNKILLLSQRLTIIGLLICLFSTPVYAQPVQRIVSLAPHLTEMIYSAGAGKYLVGVAHYSDYPKAAADLPIVSDYQSINLERIVSLKPDLILAWASATKRQDIERLKRLGFKVWLSEIKTLADIPDQIEQIGHLAGTQSIADKEAARLRRVLSKTGKTYQHLSPVTAFYEVWHKPLITVNGQQFIGQAIDLCGGKNVFADLTALAPQVSLESLLLKNPDVFLVGGEQSTQQIWIQDWQRYPMLKAVKHHQFYRLNSDLYQRPTARLIDALPALCRQLNQARKAYRTLKR